MFTIYGKCDLFDLEQDFNSKDEAMEKFNRLLSRRSDWESLEIVDRSSMIVITAKYA